MIWITAIILVILIGVFFFAAKNVIDELKNQELESYRNVQSLLAKQTAENIETAINLIIEDLEVTRGEEELLSGNEDKEQIIIDRIQGRLDHFVDSSYFLNELGHVQVRSPFKESYKGIIKDYSQKPGVKEVLEGSDTTVSKIFQTGSNKTSFSVVTPVKKDGDLKGAIRTNLHLETILNKYILPTADGEKRHSHLIIDEFIYEENGKIRKADNGLIESIRKGTPIGFTGYSISENNIELVTTIYPFKIGNSNWAIFIATPKEAIFENISENVRKIWIFTGSLIVGLIILGIVVNLILTKSLQNEVKRKTKEIKKINKNLEKLVLKRTAQIKKQSIELENLNKGLEGTVNIRTKELKGKVSELEKTRLATLNMLEDLDETNKHLQDLDKAKSNFLNIVSHELKTPLTAMFAYLDILEDYKGDFTEEENKSLDAIRRNSRQLKNLINNILEVSRIEAGKFEIVNSDINPIDKISDVIENLKPLAENKGVKLIAKTDQNLNNIFTDEQC